MSLVRIACFGLITGTFIAVLPPTPAAAGDLSVAPPSPPLRFRVFILPTFPGGSRSFAEDVNQFGQVVGGATMPGTSYPNAVTWIGGDLINITGNGVSGAAANAINNQGVVVGGSDSLGLSAFSWQNGVLTPLMNPAQCCSIAQAVNDAGQITGNVSLNGPNTPNDGGLWENGQLIPLDTLGGTLCAPYDINSHGTIVGQSDVKNNGEYFAFIREDGVTTQLEGLGGTFDAALAINDSGLVVGHAAPGPFGRRAVKWVDGKAIPLASLGGPLSSANDVNNLGWIVGDAWTSAQGSTTATLWIGDQAFDLTRSTLLSPGDHLYDARGVNNGGIIVGEGFFMDGSPGLPGGGFRGFVLQPLRLGDVNGDDAVNVQDLLGVIGDWGACPQPQAVSTCPGDLDSNGTVNVADLLMVIGDWG